MDSSSSLGEAVEMITLTEHKINEEVRQLAGIEDKLRVAWFRWYGHVHRKETYHYLRKAARLPGIGREKGRLTQRWKENDQKDMESGELKQEDVYYQWRRLVHSTPTP